VLGRLGAAGDGEPQALLGRAAVVAAGDEAGEERVPGAHRRDGLHRGGRDLVGAALVAVFADQKRGEAALGPGDHRIRGPERDQAVEPEPEILAVGELVSAGALGLACVRGDGGGLRAERGEQGSPSVSTIVSTPSAFGSSTIRAENEAGTEGRLPAIAQMRRPAPDTAASRGHARAPPRSRRGRAR
jgi:hypothetical protein